MPGVVEVELITTIESPRPDAAGAAGGSLTGSVTSAGGSAGAAGGSLTGGSLTGSVTSAGGSAGAAGGSLTGGSLTGSVTPAGGSAGAAGGSLTGSVTSAGGSAVTGSAGASLTGSAPTWARATPAHAKQTRAIASATPRCGVFGGRALIPRSPRRRAVSVGEKLPSDWPHVTRTLVMTGKVRVPPFRNRCSRPRQSDFFRVVQFSLSDHESVETQPRSSMSGTAWSPPPRDAEGTAGAAPSHSRQARDLRASTTSSASP